MSRGIIIIGTCASGLTALHSVVHPDKVLIVASNDFTEDTLPVFNSYDGLIQEIPDLEMITYKDFPELEDRQTFPFVKGEKDITCAATAFRDIPLAIPLFG